jgi:hypothetical protein
MLTAITIMLTAKKHTLDIGPEALGLISVVFGKVRIM